MIVFFYLFVFSVIVQLFYYLIFFGRLALFYENPKYAHSSNTSNTSTSKSNAQHSSDDNIATNDLPEVSIIICAKNEAVNLKQNLPFILSQEYPQNFEVVVVNDCSIDNSLQILESFSKEFPYIEIINITDTKDTSLKGKKNALNRGISSAKFSHLLLTDADCRPSSNEWLRLMGSSFISNNSSKESNKQIVKHIVLGYGPYEYRKGWLNKCIQYETLITATQYCSHSKWKIPYMGIGRNMAYTKEKFFQGKCFKNIGKFVSGDDDLFISEVAQIMTLY